MANRRTASATTATRCGCRRCNMRPISRSPMKCLTEAIVTGPPPVVHRYRITVELEFHVRPLPKPADRPGESFEYAGNPFAITNIGPIPQRPPGGGNRRKPRPTRTRPTPAALGDRRFDEAAVKMPENSVTPSASIRRSARAKPASRSVPRASSRQEGPTPPACPILTVADGFDELSRRRAENRRRADRHRSHRFPHLRDFGCAWRTSRSRIRGR